MQLVAEPRRFAALLAASAATTLVLAAAFYLCILTVSGANSISFGVAISGFMIAAAAGNATPLPGGVGSTEAALTGMLLANGLTLGHALQTALVFRAITFWSPPLLGLALIRPLRARGAL